MTDPRRTTRMRLTWALCAIAGLATLAETASSSLVRKGAVLLCFVVLAALYWLPGNSSSDVAETTSDDDDRDDRQALPARLAWAVWLSMAAAACVGIAQLAGVLTPALQLPLRGLGVVLLVVAAYKLLFGRRGSNTDIDL